MGVQLWLILPLLLPLLNAVPVSNCSCPDKELDLPPYLRGIGWRNVQKELSKDLRLVSSLRPISYDIFLNVSVRGYRGANRSTFDGSSLIALNATSPVSQIELHSVGLNIKKAQLLTPSSIIDLNHIHYNRERETVVFILPSTLQARADIRLKVFYNGTSQVRGIGLYESWTDRKGSKLPSISLVTNCEPTGARRWFPGFDEPDKKATFRLLVIHPTELTAYANTAGKSKALNNELTETTFEPTVPLPTYTVALALTEQPATKTVHNGQKIGVIGGRDYAHLTYELPKAIDFIKKQPAFKNVTFIPQKTDWLVVNDYPVGAMENPGLITSATSGTGYSIQVHELAHMYFGNLVTLRSWEQIWLNEGFARFYQINSGYYFSWARSPRGVLQSMSVYEPAMHHPFTYTRSQFVTDHFLTNIDVHYTKAGQLISLMRRFIGDYEFDRALNKYLIANSFGNGDSDMLIDYLSETKPEARAIMRDFVHQPGVALLTVDVENMRVVIQQRRFLRTDFIKNMRDTKTRWSIPIYYKIYGVQYMKVFSSEVDKLIINIPWRAKFSIDESYPNLYNVHYKTKDASKIKKIKDQITLSQVTELTDNKHPWHNIIMSFCTADLKNKTRQELMEIYLVKKEGWYLMCDKSLQSRIDTKRFLRELLITNELPIRNSDLSSITISIHALHAGILLEFLTEEHRDIDFLYHTVWEVIKEVAMKERGGIEKLRDIVRVNPSFAANFYHMFAKIFEQDFIKREENLYEPTDDDISNYYYYYWY